jgi:hypothetical protein
MNSKRLIILSVILLGSLWGLAELWIGERAVLRSVPIAPIQTAAGILALVLARRVWGTPGSSFGVAAVASAYKFLQQPVWGCKIAAVLLVGAVFDAGFTFYEARRRRMPAGAADVRVRCAVVLSAVVTLASFVLFGLVARYLFASPFWAVPGKMIDYQLVQGAFAVTLAVPAALAGLKLGERLVRSSRGWDGAHWAVYRAAAAGSTIAGVATAIALRG